MRWVIAIAVALLASLFVPGASASHVATDEFRKGCPFSEDEWEDDVYDCGGRIPSIQNPSFGSGDWLEDDDVVIGVEHGGVAKAYPIRILDWHEIANDRIEGIPIVVSYCPLCASSVVFERTVDGQVLDFHVSGYLFQSDLVMVDEQTHSLWPQIEGTGARGELHGTDLTIFPSQTTGWQEWREKHPDTLVLERPGCNDGSTENRGGCNGEFQRNYNAYPYGNYQTSRQVGISGEQRDTVQGLHPKDMVVGFVVDGTPKAYPFFLLDEERVINDDVADTPVVIAWAGSDGHGYLRPSGEVNFSPGEANDTLVDDQGNVYDAATGTSETGPALQPLDGLDLFWFAWLDHHPKTLLYTSNGTVEVDHEPPRSTPGPSLGGTLAGLAAALGALALARRVRQDGR